ncbi:hypothetical protein WJX72_006474 [[Myrmecia] bisecta]|uniref:Uncharacterized protein n=1 Tax=[Myrmecia] bisecta TaxID=41462 RepID=A0AAW1Q5D4_9CHLO
MTSLRLMGYGSNQSDNDPDVLEREKQKNLRGENPVHMPGVEGWNENLASESEASVKAERHAPDNIKELQEFTLDYLTKNEPPAEEARAQAPPGDKYGPDGGIGH